MPWLLILLGLGGLVATVIDPMNLLWIVLFIPLWLVAFPLVVAPLERKGARKVGELLERRRQVRDARSASAYDPQAGLSLAEGCDAGALTVVQERKDEDRGGGDDLQRSG